MEALTRARLLLSWFVLTMGSFEPRGNTLQEKTEGHVCGKSYDALVPTSKRNERAPQMAARNMWAVGIPPLEKLLEDNLVS